MEIVGIFVFALGVIFMPALRFASVWWALAIIGAGLVGYIISAGAFIGGYVCLSV